MVLQAIQQKKWLLLALIILAGNVVAYQFTFIQDMPATQSTGVVMGSLIDCGIIVPALLLLQAKKWSWKKAILYATGGIIFARMIIPAPFIAPFAVITWAGILVEVAFVIIEICLLLLFVRYLPAIIGTVKASSLPLIFSFPQAVIQKVPNNFIIQILCAELLMFYYAFFTWRKKVPTEGFTVHKKSMYIPVIVMVFHACIFEAVAFHWLTSDRWPVLAWIHLALTVYGLVFFLADFNATRLHPAVVKQGKLYLANGLMKRTVIDLQQIKAIHQQVEEDVYLFAIMGSGEDKPQFVLEMQQPQTISMMMGIEKQVRFIGIVVDEPLALRQEIEQRGCPKS